MHARWAMLGVVGLILPDLLGGRLLLLPDLFTDGRLFPLTLVVLTAIGGLEAYRAAYKGRGDVESRVYPGRRLGRQDLTANTVTTSWQCMQLPRICCLACLQPRVQVSCAGDAAQR